MENKLSKGGSLRIKSPQLYHPATSINQALPTPPLHSGAGDRSELRSAGQGGAPRATVAWHPLTSGDSCNCERLRTLVLEIEAGGARVAAFEGPGCAMHGWTAVRP